MEHSRQDEGHGEHSWRRMVGTYASTKRSLADALETPANWLEAASEGPRNFFTGLNPRVRILWLVAPVILVLLFPQETTSGPQAFTLIAVVLFLLLGTNGTRMNVVLVVLTILIVINMREVPDAIFRSGPDDYPLQTGPSLLLVALPLALLVAYGLHLWKGADLRLLCAVLVLATLPLTLSLGPSAEPRTFVLFLIAFNIVLGLGLNVVVGYAGLLDLGFVAFFALGGYAWAVMSTDASNAPLGDIGAPFWIILPVAVALAAVVGVLLGFPVLRLRGDYLAIVTLGFGEIIRIIAINADGQGLGGNLTNGVSGVREIGNANPFPEVDLGLFSFGGELVTNSEAFWLALVCALLVGVAAEQLRDSKVGRAWEAIREDEDVAQGMGVNTVHYKLLAFGLGAAIGGLGGAVRTSHFSTVTPADFQLLVSINVLAIVIIGGMGSVRGVVLGAFILAGMPEILRDVSLRSIVDGGLNVFFLPEFVQALPIWLVEQLPWQLAERDGQELRLVLFGLLLVVMMVVRPQGLAPSARRQFELVEMVEQDAGDIPDEVAGFKDDATGDPPSSPIASPQPEPGRPGGSSEQGD